MASLFNRFKKSKPAPAKAERAPAREAAPIAPAPAVSKKGERRVLGFDLMPHMTEKSNAGSEHNWYTFRVPLVAGKIVVKQAVEDRYRVNVLRVRISPVRPRSIRVGRIEGTVPGFKKAMVKVREGQKIEFT